MGAKRKAVMLGCSDGRDRKGFTKELAAVLDLEGEVSAPGEGGVGPTSNGGTACAEMRWHEVFCDVGFGTH